MSLERRKTTEQFIKEAKSKWGNKYDYSLTIYTTRKNKIKVICDGIIYEQLPHNHIKYAPEKLSIPMTTDFFIVKSLELNGNRYNYDNVSIISSGKKVSITCNKEGHGEFLQTPHSHIQGKGCPKCRDSKGNKIIKSILDENNVEYQQEYKFNDCRNKQELPFDFFIKSINTCIEFDGIQHYKPVTIFGGDKKYEITKFNDNIKDKYCNDNNINLVRISYKEIGKIKNIIETIINKKSIN